MQSSCMQLPQDYCQTQNFDRGTTAYSYATPSLRQDRSTSLYGQPVSTFLYQRDSMQANCSSKPDLMLGNTNDPWPWTMTNTGSSYSAEDHELLQMFPYHTISESLSQPCHGLAGASSLRSRMPFTSDSSFDMSSPPPSSLHSGYSTSGTIPDESQSHLQFRAAVQNENAHPRMAWDGTLNTIQGQMGMDGFGSGSYSASHCGFRSNDPWLLGSLPATNWSNQTSEPRTISPKVLTLDSSSTIMPVKCPEIFNSDRKVADTKPKSLEDSADLPQPPKQSRKRLPAGKPPSFPEVPIIPSTNMKKITKSRARSPRTNSPIPKPTSSKVLSRVAPAKKLPSARQAKNIQPKLEAATALPACNPSEFGSTVPPAPDMSFELSPKVKALKRQESRDRFLVRSKLAGMSYKEIRKAGAFSEAESTLRGRFRTLTKEKEARVRRPEWEENDVCIFQSRARKSGINEKIDQPSAKSGSKVESWSRLQGTGTNEGAVETCCRIYFQPWGFVPFWICYLQEEMG